MRGDGGLQEKLGKGFFVHNLYQMASLCRALAMDATDPLPFFVIQHILSDIATDWEGRPLPVDEAESLESRLRGLINEVIEARQAGASPEEMYNHLNALVIAFLASPT